MSRTTLGPSVVTLRDAYRECLKHAAGVICGVWSPDGFNEITLAETHRRAGAVARRLAARGVGKGDVIAVQLPNCVEWPVVCVAAAELGAVIQPVSTALGAHELGQVLADSGAMAIVTPGVWRGVDYGARLRDAGELPTLKLIFSTGAGHAGDRWAELEADTDLPLPEVVLTAEDLAFLIYTSGTTSKAKGVRHTHRSLVAEIAQLMSVKPPEGASMAPWPAGHIAGVLIVLRFLAAGTTTIMMERWNAEAAARLIEQFKVISSSATPFFLTEILDVAEAKGIDLSTLADIQCGAAPVPPSLIERFSRHGLVTYRSYGSTEHPTVTYGRVTDSLERRMTTEGRVLPDVDLKIVDDDGADLPIGQEGEVVTRGPDMFSGYQNASLDAAAFLPDGWYKTGDIGRLDEENYLTITDRKKDIIIRAGENISSREVEEHLLLHPEIAEAAVVAAPDPRMGELVCAFVVPSEGGQLDLGRVQAYFESRGVSRRKTPELLRVVTSLPRNATGKILKQELRSQLLQTS